MKKTSILLLASLMALPLQAANYTLNGTATEDAFINLTSDTDNSGESDNAWIYFSQDGGSGAYAGFVGVGGNAPDSAVTYNNTIDNAFLVGTKANYPLQLGTQGNARLTIDVDGHVGIYTTTPEDKLHIAQGHLIGEYISDSSTASSFKGVKARGTAAAPLPPANGDYLVVMGGGGYNGTTLYNYNKAIVGIRTSEAWTSTANGTYITFETTPNGSTTRSRRMRIDHSGNVGIGTDTPTHLLSVDGTIRAKEIIVDTGWADDVFSPGYHLASLTEVEKHIEAKGHLPGIPSANEISTKGVSLGESQSLLLRKIEELTLHMIEHEKAIASLKQENTKLKQELKAAMASSR
jgi:hypothetical protein